MNAIFFVL